MGLFGKFKNVLFEETEVDIPVINNEDEKIEAAKPKNESTIVEKKVEAPKEKTAPIKKIEPEEITPVVSKTMEIDDFKAEPTFEFPVFDENDFSNTIRERTNSRNVLEHEKLTKTKRIDKVKVEDITEVKSFTPSPIISPVYGVLDQNYKKEDIMTKKEASKSTKSRGKNDIDTIRNKAYGTLEDDIEGLIPEKEDKIEEELPTKSIDELIADAPIQLGEDLVTEEIPIPKRKPKAKAKKEELDKALSALDDFEEDLERSRSNKDRLESDTLETDLFNLIDSMYENKEEGDE